MDVLGEPVRRQLMAELGLARFAVDQRAHRSELIAQTDIVEEARHLVG